MATIVDRLKRQIIDQGGSISGVHTIKEAIERLDLDGSGDEDISDLIEAYRLMDSRVDNIVAQAGTDNTEIVDARNDADGHTYTVLKNRLDTEHSQLKSQIDAELGYYSSVSATITYTDGYAIRGSGGANPGEIYESAPNSISNKISLDGVDKFSIYYTGLNPSGTYFLYTADDIFIASSNAAIPSAANKTETAVPSNASYLRFYGMTSRKNTTVDLITKNQGLVYAALDTKLDKNQGVENAGELLKVGSDGNVITVLEEEKLPVYMRCHPFVPLMPDMCADFAWCSMRSPSAFTGHNVVLTVSGTSGNSELTVSDISGATMSDFSSYSEWIGGVLTTDGTAYKVVNFKYKSATSVEIYPKLDTNISGATLATLMYDSGETYVGMHLTEHGYRAYMYYLYNMNPRHCEVGKYIAAYRPYLDNEVNPLTKYGGNIYVDIESVNRNNYWLHNYTTKCYRFRFSSYYTPYEQKTGVEWEVNLKGKSGYLELYIAPICARVDLPEGQEVYVDVYIDGVRNRTVLNTNIGKRICVDFENAKTGKLDIFCNKWATVDGEGTGFYISRICWWVNELDYSDLPLFPAGSVVAQEFDSWGEFHDDASGVAFESLHNEATGVSVPFTNHSLGGQTSAWGMAWWYENVWKYHPSIAMTDFVINDANSDTPGFQATVEGPDGTVYNNIITQNDYVANSKTIINEAINNAIQPILMRACQHGASSYIGYTLALIDGLAVQID